jgi:hypothetical protein
MVNQSSNPGLVRLVDIYTRGSEFIIVQEYLDVSLESVFASNVKYYHISERLAKVYLY